MQSVKTENVNSQSFETFVDRNNVDCISPPTDLLLLRSLITCFILFTKADGNKSLWVIFNFCLIVLMLGWFTHFIKLLSLLLSIMHAGKAFDPSVHICRSNDSVVIPKYSLNVAAISLFLKIVSPFSFNIISDLLHCVCWKVRFAFLPKKIYFLCLNQIYWSILV